MRRVVVVKDNKESLDQRTENLMRDVTRQLDHDLRRFGFRGGNLGGGHDDDLFGKVLGSRSLFGGSSSSPSKSTPTITTSVSTNDTSLGDCAALGIGNDPAGHPFSVNFDLRGFEADEISVSCEDGVLGVSARREVVVDGAMNAKEFNRKVKLPPHVDPEHLSSLFTNEGILTIESSPPPSVPAPKTPQSTIPEPTTTTTTAASGHRSFHDDRSVSCLSADTSASGSLPLDTPIFTMDSAGVRKMSLVLELGPEYGPEDVTVRLEERRLIVDACREVKGEGKSSKVSVQRNFELAEDIDSGTVEAVLRGAAGRLSISALVEKKGRCKVVAG